MNFCFRYRSEKSSHSPPVVTKEISPLHKKDKREKHKKRSADSSPKPKKQRSDSQEVVIRDKEKKHKEKKHKKSEKKSKHSPSSSKKKRKKSKHASKSSSLEKSASGDLSASPPVVDTRTSPRQVLVGHEELSEGGWEEEDLPPRKNGPGEIQGERCLTPPVLQRVASISSPHTPPLPPKAYENSKLDKRYKPIHSPGGR